MSESQHRRSSPLLHESPYAEATRPLTDEPLTVEDWAEVYRAHRAFTVHVRMIVDRARERAGQVPPCCEHYCRPCERCHVHAPDQGMPKENAVPRHVVEQIARGAHEDHSASYAIARADEWRDCLLSPCKEARAALTRQTAQSLPHAAPPG